MADRADLRAAARDPERPRARDVWAEDETIGWVYQYFNGEDERRKMREESQAPRNSRELAVRNQFFTPRYVVEFLTDNTLGRIWYEMRGEPRPRSRGASASTWSAPERVCSTEPRAEEGPARPARPRPGLRLRALPALRLRPLLTIYEEAWDESPPSEATGRTLSEDYPSLDALRKAVPGLILEHNLHGVDIDPRCAQIAELALWLRAQKAYATLARAGRAAADPPLEHRLAEPLVADEQIAEEFVAKLDDPELGRVFMGLVESLSLAGDLGLLLRVEQLVTRQAKPGQTGDLFAPPEERIRAALVHFVREETGWRTRKRRLFADDASHGVGAVRRSRGREVRRRSLSESSVRRHCSTRAKHSTFAKATHELRATLCRIRRTRQSTVASSHMGVLGAITSRTGLLAVPGVRKVAEEVAPARKVDLSSLGRLGRRSPGYRYGGDRAVLSAEALERRLVPRLLSLVCSTVP